MFEQYSGRTAELLSPPCGFHPFPLPGGWEELPTEFKKTILETAEKYIGYEWPLIPATYFLDFSRNGDRTRHFGRYMHDRRVPLLNLVLAECIKNDGRYLDDIVNGLWAILDESTWVLPAHDRVEGTCLDIISPDKMIIDLFSAETGSLLSWTYYFLKPRLDTISPHIGERLVYEVRRRLLTPFLTLRYWWMEFGANNWNPWIVSNILTCAAVVCPPGAELQAVVEKAMEVLDNFVGGYHSDGGCDEGPAYWQAAGGALYDCLELLSDLSGGAIDVFSAPITHSICAYIYKMHIADNYYVNFADAHAVLDVNANLLYRMGERLGDDRLVAQSLAARELQLSKGSYFSLSESATHLYRRFHKLLTDSSMQGRKAEFPFVRDVYLDGIQVMAAREESGSSHGLYLAAKGGHNGESHNHNDIGSFVIYCGGEPLLIDIGSGQYTAKTFSPDRYEIRQMQSSFHSVPEINGLMQKDGSDYRATQVQYSSDDSGVSFSLNMEEAYPLACGLKSLRRSLHYDRKAREITLLDEYALESPGELVWNFLSAIKPYIRDGSIVYTLESCRAALLFNADIYSAEAEMIPMDDNILRDSWGEACWRLRIVGKEKSTADKFSVTVKLL